MTRGNVDRRQFLQSATLVATAATAATGALAADAPSAEKAPRRTRAAQPSAKSGEVQTRRWTEQRWQLENAIREVGEDRDQTREVTLYVASRQAGNQRYA